MEKNMRKKKENMKINEPLSIKKAKEKNYNEKN